MLGALARRTPSGVVPASGVQRSEVVGITEKELRLYHEVTARIEAPRIARLEAALAGAFALAEKIIAAVTSPSVRLEG